MSTPTAIDFVVFYVSDLEAAFQYFTETLGFLAAPGQNGPTFRAFVPAPGSPGFGISLVDESSSPEPRQPGNVEIYFKVEHIEDEHQTLEKRGIPVTTLSERPFGKFFSVPAPDNHIVTIFRPPTR